MTICAFERQNLFQHQDFREIAVQALARIPTQEHARHVAMDESVVMPNHVHVIFEFTDYPAQAIGLAPAGQLGNAVRGSLGVVVGRYKTAVTTRINKLRQRTGLPINRIEVGSINFLNDTADITVYYDEPQTAGLISREQMSLSDSHYAFSQ